MEMNKKMTRALWSALAQPADLVIMKPTKLDEPIPPTIIKDVIMGDVKNTMGGVPLMPGRKKTSVQGK